MLKNLDCKFTVENYITREPGTLEPLLDSNEISQKDILQIKKIFNSELVYRLFERSRKGRKFTVSDIQKYIAWSAKQTSNGRNVTYFVRDSAGVLCAGLDLQKVNDKVVTIGYWSDNNKPGFITNAVLLLLGVAKNLGYITMDAYPEDWNIKSQRVLERSGFHFVERILKDGYVLLKYEGKL